MWYVIPIIVAFLGAVFFLNLLIVFYYEHPDDSKYTPGLVAKITALTGFELMWLLLVIIPTDGFNANSDQSLDIELLWGITLTFIALYLLIPIPLSTSFYEADTDPRTTKTPPWLNAFKKTGIIFVCVAVVYVGMYFAFRSSKVEECDETTNECILVEANTPFLLFPAIFVGFIGWILVVLYLGVGVIAVPQGLILSFVDRPKPISQHEYNDAKMRIGETIVALKVVGENLRERQGQLRQMTRSAGKWNKQRMFRNDLNKFRQSVHLVENDFEALNTAFKMRGENPFFAYLKLITGCFAVVLSMVWYLHFILYIVVPTFYKQPILGGFLDGLFEWITKAHFYPLDLLVYEILVGYLMLCQMIGCFRFNLRMFFCFSIHPMKKGDTRANSILFNVSLTLLSAHGIAHLSYDSFRGYCAGGFSEVLYGQYAANTPMIGVMYRNNVFVWILTLWIMIVSIFFSLKPRDQIAFSVDRIKAMKITKPKEGKANGAASSGDLAKEGGGMFAGVDQAAEKKMAQVEKAVKFLG